MSKYSFQPGTAVVFEPKWVSVVVHPLRYGELVYFLTDIPNIPDHCIVATFDGRVVPMIHPDELRIATEEEV